MNVPLSPLFNTWHKSGEYISFGPHQVFVKRLGQAQASPEKTALLIHGFPESSFSFHAVVEGLLKTFDTIILMDMIGYGLSDKPTNTYGYSLFEQADVVLTAWKHFGIQGGHIIAHDMGDSVTTEILARHENNTLPHWFSKGIQSITFTNGSMVLELAKLRITQKLLLSKFGKIFNKITNYKLFSQQVKSAHGNKKLTNEKIERLWEGNRLQDGHLKTYLTIRYLKDRKQFEKTRWLPALRATQIPIHLCWGQDDAVARVEMAYYLKENICPQAQLTIMPNVGHFCQLGSPNEWLKHIKTYYK